MKPIGSLDIFGAPLLLMGLRRKMLGAVRLLRIGFLAPQKGAASIWQCYFNLANFRCGPRPKSKRFSETRGSGRPSDPYPESALEPERTSALVGAQSKANSLFLREA